VLQQSLMANQLSLPNLAIGKRISAKAARAEKDAGKERPPVRG
jgi:hypothetical protein